MSDQSTDELSSIFEIYSIEDILSNMMCPKQSYKIIKKYIKTDTTHIFANKRANERANKRATDADNTTNGTNAITNDDINSLYAACDSNYIFVNITSMSTQLLNYMLEHNTCSYIVELPDSYFF
jgi:4-diphosphocytidyl-2C-methyl-D-erythritol kinase